MSFISRTITNIREIAGEPSIHSKYTDTRLLTWIQQAYGHVIGEMNRRSAAPIVIRHDITLDEDIRVYTLPPIVQRILDIKMMTDETDPDSVLWHVQPRSRYNPVGAGILFEHNMIRFTDDPVTDYILRIEFVPSGTADLNTGTIDASGADFANSTANNNCVITLPAAPTTGSLDTRPNAYAGSIFRVLADAGVGAAADYVQERIIESYDVTTRKITVTPAFEAGLVPAGAELEYEIAPMLDDAFDMAVATYVARQLANVEGESSRVRHLNLLWQEQLGDIASQVAYYNALTEGAHRDTRFSHSPFVPHMWLGNRGHRA